MFRKPESESYGKKRRVCLTAGGKDTGGSHKEVIKTMNLQVGVDDACLGVGSHARRADLMIPIRRLLIDAVGEFVLRINVLEMANTVCAQRLV